MILILILVFTLFTRTLFLNSFPTGVTNDEVHFILNAKSVFLNFSSLADNWHPLSFTTIPGEASSEVPFILMAPIIGLLPSNLFTARIFHTLLGTAVIFLIYLISAKLVNRKAALIIAALSSINPWLFYVYRTSFDAPIAIFFILLTITLLFYLRQNRLFLALIPLTLAFYSYIGTKPIIFLITALTAYYSYRILNRLNYQKQFLGIAVFSLILTVSYLFSLRQSSSANRTGELITPWSPEVSEMVRLDRTQTADNSITAFFSNRFTMYSKFVISKWFNSFSPNLLFLKGDDTLTGSLWHFGYFYIIDAFFILFGLVSLFRANRPLFILLLSLLLFSPIPEAIRKDVIPAYVFHSAFQFPLLVILSGIGIYYFTLNIKSKIINLSLSFVYLLSFLNLLFIYFFQYPYYASEAFSFSDRLLANVLISETQVNPHHIYVVTAEPDTAFKMYVFYADLLNRQSFPQISTAYQNRSLNILQFNNITFLTPDNEINPALNDAIIVKEGVNYSPKDSTNKKILKRLDNSQVVYNLFNLVTCSGPPKAAPPVTLSDFLVKPADEFLCHRFISDSF